MTKDISGVKLPCHTKLDMIPHFPFIKDSSRHFFMLLWVQKSTCLFQRMCLKLFNKVHILHLPTDTTAGLA